MPSNASAERKTFASMQATSSAGLCFGSLGKGAAQVLRRQLEPTGGALSLTREPVEATASLVLPECLPQQFANSAALGSGNTLDLAAHRSG
jgi:hypothetical protein